MFIFFDREKFFSSFLFFKGIFMVSLPESVLPATAIGTHTEIGIPMSDITGKQTPALWWRPIS